MGQDSLRDGETEESGIRVLHVDDDPDILDLTAAKLERENPRIEVVGCLGADRAGNRLAEGDIDCVVSDYDMPGVTGLDLLQRVRANHDDLPFILFTGKGSEEVASEAISQGVDDYLQKGHGSEQYELLATRIENLVSERRAREAVDRREARFRSLFENIPDPAVIVEFQAGEPTVRAINDAFQETFGFDPVSARGESLNELIVPMEETADAATVDRAAKAGEQIEREVRRKTADGEVRDFLFRNALITPVEDDSRAHFGVYTDVTELRRRERELELYETIVDEAPDAIYALDTDLEFLLANGVLAAALDRPADEILGESIRILADEGIIDGDRLEGLLADFRAVLRGERDELRFEATVRAAGQTVVTENHVTAVADDGDPYALVNIVRDVTERRRREEQLRNQNARLEEFASVVSHDLRNPLSIAMGNVRIARERGDPERLEPAERALDRMERFIGDLLTLAREGQTVQETRPVVLADAVEAAWEAVDGHGTLTVEFDTETINADPDRLHQVLENLLVNAAEHGDTPVDIRVGPLSDGHGFFVEDDGRGIPPDEREAVFEHGYTTSEDGTGFGLSIVRGIVEAHGWAIDAVDPERGGARFEISGVLIRDEADR